MLKFGSIQSPSGGARPSGLQVNYITGKCMFFLGDRWLEVGPVLLLQTGAGVRPVLPNFDQYFEERKGLDDGTEEWRTWGPRVN